MSFVLVAEDDRASALLLDHALRRAGHVTAFCRDGETFLARALAERPTAGILDHDLPGISGLEVIRRLRADPAFAGVPLVVVTALDEGETHAALLAAGAHRVLTKPFSPRELVQVLAEALGR